MPGVVPLDRIEVVYRLTIGGLDCTRRILLVPYDLGMEEIERYHNAGGQILNRAGQQPRRGVVYVCGWLITRKEREKEGNG